ncbi:metalloendopeptidase, glycoprotease family, partial [mine drainage metagenome]
MAVIGMESSAHTFGVGIVEKGKVLSNIKAMYPISDKGIIPAEVAEFHSRNADKVIKESLDAAGISTGEVDAVGYTKGPGLGPCLSIAFHASAKLSKSLRVPLIPVNHAMAHIEIAKNISGFEDPIVLYVSGA